MDISKGKKGVDVFLDTETHMYRQETDDSSAPNQGKERKIRVGDGKWLLYIVFAVSVVDLGFTFGTRNRDLGVIVYRSWAKAGELMEACKNTQSGPWLE